MKLTVMLCLARSSRKPLLAPAKPVDPSSLFGRNFRILYKANPGYYILNRDQYMWINSTGENSKHYRYVTDIKIVRGLAGEGTISFERSTNYGVYVHSLIYYGKVWQCMLNRIYDGSSWLREDASWIPRQGLADPYGLSFESFKHSGYFMRPEDFKLKISPFKDTHSYRNEATWYPLPVSKVLSESADNDETLIANHLANGKEIPIAKELDHIPVKDK
uniref:Alpha-L-arabinofuranosidase B arabinose-binding domain-containing protein n=1 Tax=Amphimedon queenslandica TaxID=400682 RepID=A0A1X7VN90_AMPQE